MWRSCVRYSPEVAKKDAKITFDKIEPRVNVYQIIMFRQGTQDINPYRTQDANLNLIVTDEIV